MKRLLIALVALLLAGPSLFSQSAGNGRTVKSKGYTATTDGITYKSVETFIDDGNMPRSLYYAIRFSEVLGVTAQDVINGKVEVELSRGKAKQQLVKEPKWYCAKTSSIGDQLNILFDIPLPPDLSSAKAYQYKLSLTTQSGKKIIVIYGMTRG